MKGDPKPSLLHTMEPYSRNLLPALRQRKEEMHVTLQDISDATGVPIDFLKKLFAGQQKSPNVFYIMAICIYLDMSLDAHFHNLTSPPPTPESNAEITQLKADIRVLEEKLGSKDATIQILNGGLRKRRMLIYILIAICALQYFALLAYIDADLENPFFGYIQNGHTSPLAWILIILATAVLCLGVSAIINAIRNYRKK